MTKLDPATMRSYWKEAERAARESAPKASARLCDHPGCGEAGTYRAPKSRQNIEDFHWFCLPHVQDYNKGWNYYQGLSMEQMEEVHRQDVVGWRQTWPLGSLRPGANGGSGANGAFDANRVTPEALRAKIFQDFFGGKAGQSNGKPKAVDVLSPDEREAFTHFNLTLKASWYEVKRRYRELAKAHHPDTHQADAAVAEEQLKLINRAYAVLKKRFKQA